MFMHVMFMQVMMLVSIVVDLVISRGDVFHTKVYKRGSWHSGALTSAHSRQNELGAWAGAAIKDWHSSRRLVALLT